MKKHYGQKIWKKSYQLDFDKQSSDIDSFLII